MVQNRLLKTEEIQQQGLFLLERGRIREALRVFQSIPNHCRDKEKQEKVLLFQDLLLRVSRRLPETSLKSRAEQVRSDLLPALRQMTEAEEPEIPYQQILTKLLEQPLSQTEQNFKNPLLPKAIAIIKERFRNKLSLIDAAEALGVSATYLSRLFRAETGKTFTRYIQTMRIEEAERLLMDSGKSISEIAYLVGYQTYRDFHRNFMKLKQETPRQVRKKLLQQAAQK